MTYYVNVRTWTFFKIFFYEYSYWNITYSRSKRLTVIEIAAHVIGFFFSITTARRYSLNRPADGNALPGRNRGGGGQWHSTRVKQRALRSRTRPTRVCAHSTHVACERRPQRTTPPRSYEQFSRNNIGCTCEKPPVRTSSVRTNFTRTRAREGGGRPRETNGAWRLGLIYDICERF